MANNFGKGIKVTSGFDLSAKAPLDNRTVVDTIAERNAHVTNNRAYPGLKVFVNSDKKEYMYDGNSWIESGGITDVQLEQLTVAYTHSMSDHVSVELVESSLADINNKLNELPTSKEVQELVDTKSDVNHDHNEDYYLKHEVDKKIVDVMTYGQVDLSGYATISDLNKKADISHDHTPSDVIGLQDALDLKANIADTATKEELAMKSDTNHGHNISEITNLQDILDTKANAASIYNRTELNMKFSEIDENINSKSDVNHDHNNDYYLKHEVDKKITDAVTDGQVDLSGYATISDLNTKANISHDHTPSDITGLQDALDLKANMADVATKEELAAKADSIHIHNISEVTGLQNELDSKAASDNVYDKAEMDNKLQTINQSINSKSDINHDHSDIYYSKSEVDDAIAKVATDGEVSLQGYATKTELSQGLSAKANISHGHTPSDIEGLNDLLEEVENNVYSKSEIDVLVTTAKTEAMTYSDDAITALVDSAPEAMDTLNELASAINENKEIYDTYVGTVSQQLQAKADVNHDHNTDYYTKAQVVELINSGISGVDLSNLATKSELTTGLSGKSDLGHGHEISEINNLQNELDAKINKDNAASKDELKAIEALLGGKADAGHDHNELYANKEHDHTVEDIVDLSEKYYTKEAMDPILSGKAEVDHDHDNDYYTKNEVDNKIEAGITDANLSQYATINYVTSELNKKADVSHDHTISDITGLQDELDLKANKNDVPTKDDLAGYSPVEHNHDDRYCTPAQVDEKIAAVDHSKYALKSEVEESLGGKSDSDHVHDDRYYTQEAVDQRIQAGIDSVDLSGLATKSELEEGLATKAPIDHVHDYANKEHNHTTEEITDLYNDIYKKKEIDDALANKSNIDHHHNELYASLEHSHDLDDLNGLGDAYYNKDEIDDALAGKANADHMHDETYSKLEHDHTVSEITDLFDNVYSESEVDTALAGKASADHNHDTVYSKLGHVHGLDELNGLNEKYYTKTEIDDALAKKASADHMHDEIYSKLDHTHTADKITDLFDNIYNKTEIDNALAGKSSSDHHHDETYSKLDHSHTVDKITDLFTYVYNKDEVDTALAGKAPADHVHDNKYSQLGHVHKTADITDLFDNVYSEDEVDTALAGKAPSVHIHAISDVTGLQSELDSKINVSIAATKAELEAGLSKKAEIEHLHDAVYSKLGHDHAGLYLTESEIDAIVDDAAADAIVEAETRAQDYTDGKIAELLGGEDSSGSTTISGLAAELNLHKQEFEAYQTEIETELSKKAEVEHTHKISDVTNLQSSLDAKANVSDVNNMNQDLQDAIGEAIVEAEARAVEYTNGKISDLINSAPEAMDTLGELAASIENYQDIYEAYIETVATALANKSDVNHHHNGVYYTKTEVDNLIDENIGDIDFSSFATKEEVKTKADSNHHHDETYSKLDHKHTAAEITDLTGGIYNKDEIDSMLSGKSDTNHNHDSSYAGKDHGHKVADITDLYNNVYSESEVDSLLAEKSDTTHQHDSRYYLKYQVDAKIAGLGIAGYAKLEDLETWAALFALKEHNHDGLVITFDDTTIQNMLITIFGFYYGQNS